MSTQDSADRLTPGTFFVLLQQALWPRTKARDSLAGKSDGLSNPNVLQGLIRIVQPDFIQPKAGDSFKQETSKLMNCHSDGGTTYLPVGGEHFARNFMHLMGNDLSGALERTKQFVDQFLDIDNKALYLARLLRTAVARDTTIACDCELVPLLGRESLTKDELLNASCVCLDALVLGLWSHVSCNVRHNTAGRATFERWHHAPASHKARWRFDAEVFGVDESWTPIITRYDPGDKESSADAGRDEEIIEAEIVDDDQASDHNETSADADFEKAHAVTPHVVFNQYGANSQQIGSVGTLNIGRGL